MRAYFGIRVWQLIDWLRKDWDRGNGSSRGIVDAKQRPEERPHQRHLSADLAASGSERLLLGSRIAASARSRPASLGRPYSVVDYLPGQRLA